jgi:hypothetical protein
MRVPAKPISLDDALEVTRTGDLWLFRGRAVADRAIQVGTNSPVNHVGMSVALDDLPPLMWHAELGRSLPDLWAGGHHRGVQLHDLRAAVTVWTTRYGQQAWLRQLDHPATREAEDGVLRTIARLDGTPFPSTARWRRGGCSAGCRVGAAGPRSPWSRRTARRWSPPPTRPWGCYRPDAGRAGTTPDGSGAVTSSACSPAPDSVARSPSTSRPGANHDDAAPHEV